MADDLARTPTNASTSPPPGSTTSSHGSSSTRASSSALIRCASGVVARRELLGEADQRRRAIADVGVLTPDPLDVLRRQPDDHVGGVDIDALRLTAGVTRPGQADVGERGPGTPADREPVDRQRPRGLDAECPAAAPAARPPPSPIALRSPCTGTGPTSSLWQSTAAWASEAQERRSEPEERGVVGRRRPDRAEGVDAVATARHVARVRVR